MTPQPSNQAPKHPSNAQSLPGWVSTFYIKAGNKRLGPYYVRRWKQNGRLHKQYIKPKDLEKVKAACQCHREQRQREREASKRLTALTGNLSFLHRLTKRATKGQITKEDLRHIQRIELIGIEAPGRPPLRRPRTFMVPLLAKRTNPSVDLRFTTYDLPNKETDEQRWQRWRKERAQHPAPRPSILFALPYGYTRERIMKDIREGLGW